jgi:hypothetical protein
LTKASRRHSENAAANDPPPRLRVNATSEHHDAYLQANGYANEKQLAHKLSHFDLSFGNEYRFLPKH